MHPNEPTLVFRAASGTWLPTAAHTDHSAVAAKLGWPYLHALTHQVARQCAELDAGAVITKVA